MRSLFYQRLGLIQIDQLGFAVNQMKVILDLLTPYCTSQFRRYETLEYNLQMDLGPNF